MSDKKFIINVGRELRATTCHIVSSFLRQSTERERESERAKAIQRPLRNNKGAVTTTTIIITRSSSCASGGAGARGAGGIRCPSRPAYYSSSCRGQVAPSPTPTWPATIPSTRSSREVCCYPIRIITTGIFSGRSLIRSQMRRTHENKGVYNKHSMNAAGARTSGKGS
uniref:Uncharacterized protein n=1 Tax=Trichogramma kaykai TaxID=54128 RepID=A0ABD2XLL2_9HYME